VRRLFFAGLALEAVAGLIGDHRAAGKVQEAISELDLAVMGGCGGGPAGGKRPVQQHATVAATGAAPSAMKVICHPRHAVGVDHADGSRRGLRGRVAQYAPLGTGTTMAKAAGTMAADASR
jgi:hypothetical protein